MDSLKNSTHSETNRPLAILAEDDDMIRELVTIYLNKLGYETISVENGQLAIDEFEKRETGSVELLVSDIIMPHVTGVQLVNASIEKAYCSKILIISGFSDETNFLENAIRHGCQFLKKPFTLSEFENKVKGLKAISPA